MRPKSKSGWGEQKRGRSGSLAVSGMGVRVPMAWRSPIEAACADQGVWCRPGGDRGVGCGSTHTLRASGLTCSTWRDDRHQGT